MRAISGGVALALVLLTAGSIEAVQPEVWLTGGIEGWNEAERESIAVTSEGYAALGLGSIPADPMESLLVWALLAEGRGVLAATGESGVLYRVSFGGDVTEAARVEQPEITALGRDGGGRILFGAAPDGALYRLDGKEAVLVGTLPESYIWRILPAGRDGALIATGDAGKIYRMDSRGALTLLADVGATHVTGLEPSRDGFVATTDSPGRLLSVSASGDWNVLYEAEEPELRAPVVAPDGTIYFAANPEGKDASGRVYRRLASGAVEPVWEALSGFVYAMAPVGDGGLWVATGGEGANGRIVRLDPAPPSSWVEVLQVDEPQVMTLAFGEGGTRWFGTGGRASVRRVLDAGAVKGQATSVVKDAGDIARWGSVNLLTSSGAEGGRISTRSGNTRIPDATWTGWETVKLSGDRGPVPSPPGRFLQWRLEIDRPALEVQEVRLFYLPANRPPRVNEVEVTGLGSDYSVSWDRGQPSSLLQELPGGVRAEFQVPSQRSNTTAASDEASGWARRYRTFTWKANDPNQDELQYDLELRPARSRTWNELTKDVESSPWVWDSSTVPDDWYVLRLTATDRPSNPPGQDMSASRTTEPFLVDNTPPVVKDLRDGSGIVRGVAQDATSAIKRLEFSVDGGDWQVLFPDDGIPDSRSESFTIPTNTLERGTRVIVIRVFDMAGNPGAGRIDIELP